MEPVLLKAPLFKGLTPAVLQEVLQHAKRKVFKPREFLFVQGKPAQAVFLVLSGQLKISQLGEDGQQVLLRVIQPGQLCGLLGVLTESASGTRYPVSAQAAGRGAVLYWERKVLRGLMERHALLALNAVAILSQRIQELQNRFRELSTERVETRLAGQLLRLMQQTGRKVTEGVLIEVPLSRQDLAQMTGTTLFTVSRLLTQWQKQGVVKATRQRVLVLKPHALLQLSENLKPLVLPID